MWRYLLVLPLLLMACATGAADPLAPEISVQRLVVPRANPGSTFSILVAVAVQNRSSDPITVSRIDVGSTGVGPFDIQSSTQNYDVTIAPGATEAVEVWAQAAPGQSEIGGEEGAVLVRGVVYYEAFAGKRRAVFSQRVRTSIGPTRGIS